MSIEEEIKQSSFRSAYQKVALNLVYTANWFGTKQQDFFKNYDITPSQFNILRILRGQGKNKISGVEIKSRMLDRNSDIPRLLDRLLKKGLITKSPCPGDKRAADIMITGKGLNVLRKIDSKIDVSETNDIHLSIEEAMQLSQLLDRFRG